VLALMSRTGIFVKSAKYAFGLPALCVFAVSYLASGNFSDSVTTSLIIATQALTGAMIWISLQKNSTISATGLIGVGFSIGSLLALFSSQLLRTTFLAEFGWLAPTALVLFLYSFQYFQKRIRVICIESMNWHEANLLACLLLLSLTYWWFWLWPIIGIIALQLVVRRSIENTAKANVIVFFGTMILFPLSMYLKGLNSFWRVWSHDQIFLEAMSYSAAKWGPLENIHSVGVEFKYHWFSLAWSGGVSIAAHSDPLFVTAITLPIVSLFVSILVLYSIAQNLTRAEYLPLLAILVFVLNDNFLDTSPVRLFHSPTYLFALVWIFGFVKVMISTVSKEIRFGVLLSGLFLIAAFGGKVSHGVVLVGGFASMMIYLFAKPPHLMGRKSIFNYCLLLSISALLSYFFLYRGMSIGSGEMLSIEFGRIGVEAGIARNESGLIVKSIATASVLLALCPVFLIALYRSHIENRNMRAINVFILGSGFTGLVLTAILNQDFGGQIYFAQSALVLAPIAVASSFNNFSIDDIWTNNKKSSVTGAISGFVYGVFGYFMWDWHLAGTDPYRTKVVITFLISSGSLILIFVLPKLLSRARLYKEERPVKHVMSLMIIVALVLSLGITRRVDNFIRFSSHDQLPLSSPNLISGSQDHREALNWLRDNSKESDIVATNRFCIPEVDYCNPKWTLVSAISQRRMLIEGYSYGQIRNSAYSQDSTLPDWAKFAGQPPEQQNRLKFSLDFAENATEVSYKFMISRSVSWFVVDHSAQTSGQRDWEPWGKTRFQNQTISIIELTDRP